MMLSQKFRIREVVLGLAVSALCVLGAPQHVGAASYTFSINAGGGVLSGSFTGVDGNANTIIQVVDTNADNANDVVELTALSTNWDGPPSPADFSLALLTAQFSGAGSALTVQFEYNIATNIITNLYVALDGKTVDCQPCAPGDTMTLNSGSPDQDVPVGITSQTVTLLEISAVPEPQASILFSLGLASIAIYTVYRRRHAVVATARSISRS